MSNNYTITDQWQKLSDIMGVNYDATKKYRIHNNIQVGQLCYSLTGQDDGALMQFTDEIYNDAGIDLYLRTNNSLNYNPFKKDNTIYITEVA